MNSPDELAPPAAPGSPRAELPGESAEALPAGRRLREFEIVSVIGQGGFGIVYLADDRTLGRQVALKEYMPSALATRRSDLTVAVRSTRHDETFAAGLRSFINEARLLAQFDHPSLLKVYQFWEDHGTAYMVMPYVQGITLDKLLPRMSTPPDEAWLRALIDPLLDALELMHRARCYHRDIAPDNILILPDGQPLLLDFGAARQVIGDMTHALTVILKTGYAPVEQYGEMPDMRQGPWTDLYALASVVEFVLTRRTPPQAVARFLADKREPLAVRLDGRYSDGFLQAIDRALAVLPANRPQNVAEMRELLARGAVQPAPADELHAEPSPLRAAPPASTRQTLARPPAAPPRAAAPVPRARPRVGLKALALGLASGVATLAVLGSAAWYLTRSWDTPSATVASAPLKPIAIEVAPAATSADATAPTATPVTANTAPSPAEATPAPPPAVATTVPPVEVTTLPPPAAQTRPNEPPIDAVEATIRELLPPQARQDVPGAAPPAAAPSPANRPARTPRAEPAGAPGAHTTARSTARASANARCADIIQRSSLGEELTEADKTTLKQECRQ